MAQKLPDNLAFLRLSPPLGTGPSFSFQAILVPSRHLAQNLCLVSLAVVTRVKGQQVLGKALASAWGESTHKAAGTSRRMFQSSAHEQPVRMC